MASFVGRQAQLKELDEMLPGHGGEPEALTVCAVAGTAGVGKTALTVHWAHTAAGRFPDGQLYVNPHGYSPTPTLRPLDALARLLRGLNVDSEQIPLDVDEAAALFRSLLAGRRVLVLLDNAAGAEQVRPLLPANPGVSLW